MENFNPVTIIDSEATKPEEKDAGVTTIQDMIDHTKWHIGQHESGFYVNVYIGQYNISEAEAKVKSLQEKASKRRRLWKLQKHNPNKLFYEVYPDGLVT